MDSLLPLLERRCDYPHYRQCQNLSLELFVLTRDHIKLLRRLNVLWNHRTQVPYINPVRPYGNSDVHGDLAEILELAQPGGDAGQTWSCEQIAQMDEAHRELEWALQVVLQAAQFQPGLYARQSFTDWVLLVATGKKQ